MGRNNINGEFWAVVSDQPTSPETFAEYALRFDIEEGFLERPVKWLEPTTFRDSFRH